MRTVEQLFGYAADAVMGGREVQCGRTRCVVWWLWRRQRWQVAGSGDSGGKWLVVETAVASGW